MNACHVAVASAAVCQTSVLLNTGTLREIFTSELQSCGYENFGPLPHLESDVTSGEVSTAPEKSDRIERAPTV